MKWMTSLVLLVAIGGAHLQCFTPNDNVNTATFSTDLSGITDFGLDLYKQLSPGQSSKNFFFSPYSIWTALTLAYFGSGGNTQRQLEAALRVSDKVSTLKLWRDLEQLYKTREQGNTQYTFNLANRAYFNESLQLRPCIKELLRNELRLLNSRDVSASVNDINNFVSETTKGRISQIVNEGNVKSTLMVLVNAAFFKGIWKYPFRPRKTVQKQFFIGPQNSAPVAMMSQKNDFRYGESSQLGARVLELPYTGDAMSMFILLPTTDGPPETRFARMVNNLNGATLQQAISNLRIVKVDVQLPRFKFELKIEHELIKALNNLGITDLFNVNLANMTTFVSRGRLRVDQVIHKAFVEVNEEGTEAAAATAVNFVKYSRVKVCKFHCNEPFVYVIRDNETNNILFLGAFQDPRGF